MTKETHSSAPGCPARFDDYEIHGVRKFDQHDRHLSYCEQVPDDEAECWSLFGHIPDGGVDCIGDFATRQHAEEIYARITGRRYTDGNDRPMTKPKREFTFCPNGHEGTFDVIAIISPDEEIIARLYYWDEPDTDEGERARESARIICEQLNHWCEPDYENMYAPIEPITGGSGRVIDSIFGVEHVQRLRPDLTEQQAIMVLKAVDGRDNSVRVINREILKAAADELFVPKPSTSNK